MYQPLDVSISVKRFVAVLLLTTAQFRTFTDADNINDIFNTNEHEAMPFSIKSHIKMIAIIETLKNQ